ncbi:MAG: DUF1553 domain-containing protein [Verrucomicrobia bacterium]|nr:DUF1553 domain-containing protein [Verrucomicrobiota bacterium]
MTRRLLNVPNPGVFRSSPTQAVWIWLALAFLLIVRRPEAAGLPVDFNRQIRPLLVEHCYPCHGPDEAKRKAGLRLDQPEGATQRLKSGVRAVVPGRPAESRLLEVITAADPDEHMPPASTGKQLSADQVAVLRRWIEEGATWRGHWAYQPVANPEPPAVKQAGWGRNGIDAFILARLESEGLAPSPEADRRTLLRRVTLDLTGLPPTVDEVDAFLADGSDGAYETLVDRLLSSQAYGERMAVPWLDLARFADSDGYHADAPRSMWQYRDWIIQAFNANQPFDRFVVDQLAGDLLPAPTLGQRVATAFNRNGMSSTEGGADPDEYLNKYVTDRVNTFGTVFLGSSIQCAECHNHKYDPFTQREYYQLYDFFNRIPEKGLDSDPAPPFLQVPTARQAADLKALDESVRGLEVRHAAQLSEPRRDWQAAQAAWEETWAAGAAAGADDLRLGPWRRVGPFAEADGKAAFERAFGPETRPFAPDAVFGDDRKAWVVEAGWKDGAVHALSSDLGATYLHRILTSGQVRTQALFLGSDDGLKVWLNGREILAKDISRGVASNQDEVQAALREGENDLLLKVVNRGGASGFYFATDREAGDPKAVALREIARLPADRRSEAQARELREHYRTTRIPEVKELGERLTAERKRRDDLNRSIPTLRVMEDMKEGRASHIRVRGDYRAKGERVTAEVPTSCLPPARYAAGTNRLDLARWLVDPAHPLTARVAVNRFWAMFFPNPIVRTANEFGTNGQPPTHPELLDWLARRFIDDGWDVKAQLRRIVLSATYRQASRVGPEAQRRDPENLLLARGPRFRLPAEMLRDNALAVSGLISKRIGGVSVRPYQPPGLWEEKMFAGNSYQVGQGEDLYRRSLYTLWKRTVPNPTLQTFDAPDRALCTVQRPSTCTPLQAFVTLNDVTYLEAARFFAARILRESPGRTPAGRIDFAMKSLLARPASDSERAALKALLDDLLETYSRDLPAAEAITRIGQGPRNATVPVADLAAWTGVASALFNLDEAVTRE